MKQVIKLAIFNLLLCVVTFTTYAQNNNKRYDYFKERTISKSYTASGTSLNINNSFGKVEIIAWDKNEIKVDIQIETSSTDESYNNKQFENIDVNESQSGGTVYLKTSTGKSKNYCRNCKNNMSIDYTIHLPTTVKLDIDNSFGATTLPDYRGELNLTSKFGSLNTGELTNAKKILVEFGNSKIKSVSNITGTFKFSNIEIATLSGNNKIHAEFCGTAKFGLGSNLTGLNLNESYSTVNVKPAAGLSATYTLRTSFGNLVNRSNITMTRMDKPDEYGPDSEKDYSGKTGNGGARIDIKSSFGKIILGESVPGDFKEKKKKEDEEV
jgi:hypothetical protein